MTGPDGLYVTLPITLRDDTGVARSADTLLCGLYRLGVGDLRDHVFAINAAESSPGGIGTEFDLKRLDPTDLKTIGPIQLVNDPADVKKGGDDGVAVATTPRPHGPTLARWAVLLAIAVMLIEVVVAWRFGPGRTTAKGTPAHTSDRRPLLRILGNVAACVPLLAAILVIAALVRTDFTANAFGFLPESWAHGVDSTIAWLAGLPATPSGESDRLVLERTAAFANNSRTDSWLIAGIALALAAATIAIYFRERFAAGGFGKLVLPLALRVGAFFVALYILLPQWQLAFKREGWPEVVIILDTSASMATIDDLKDPLVRARAEALAGNANLNSTHRLQLARLLLTQPGGDWLDRLLNEKRTKVHVYALDTQSRLIATASDDADIPAAREAFAALKPDGENSRLGDGVEAVVRAYKGGSLAAVIMFTDGVTTAGADLTRAAESIHVPLYLIGMGDPWVVPDLRLSDPVHEDSVARGDTLDFRARLSSRGAVPSEPFPVVLYENVAGQLIERGRTTATPGPAGTAVKVSFTPSDLGEKTLVLEVPPLPGEIDASNNRIERRIVVNDPRRVRVLFVEGEPRYEFRFLKAFLERESEKIVGNKSVEFKTVLLGASRGWAETDRSALADFPTRDQLFEFDVIILGDFDPKQLPHTSRALQDIAHFVREKGGGVLFAAGDQHNPAVFADTPLADILPVIPAEGLPSKTTPAEELIIEGFRPQLTPIGRNHPLFRLSPDPVESDKVWSRLQPVYWWAKNYRRKPAAEVLAVHPDRPAEGSRENHPLILQQFFGAGRVLFFGIDETWRWRWRSDEEQFNRFWMQALRTLARSHRGRIELKLDPAGPYRRDDRITVKARFPDDAPVPPEGTVVRVRVQREPLPGQAASGQAESAELLLSRVKSERAEFEAVLTRTPEGIYRFTLTEPDAGATPPRAEARVLPPPPSASRST